MKLPIRLKEQLTGPIRPWEQVSGQSNRSYPSSHKKKLTAIGQSNVGGADSIKILKRLMTWNWRQWKPTKWYKTWIHRTTGSGYKRHFYLSNWRMSYEKNDKDG